MILQYSWWACVNDAMRHLGFDKPIRSVLGFHPDVHKERQVEIFKKVDFFGPEGVIDKVLDVLGGVCVCRVGFSSLEVSALSVMKIHDYSSSYWISRWCRAFGVGFGFPVEIRGVCGAAAASCGGRSIPKSAAAAASRADRTAARAAELAAAAAGYLRRAAAAATS